MMIFEDLSKYRTQLMGVAMLSVFLFHSMGGDWMPRYIYNIASHGNIGVDVFLFLSAMGLTYSLTNNPDIWAFYKRRVWRIIPTYWFIMTGVYLFVYVLTSVHIMPDNYYRIPRSLYELLQSYTTFGFWIKDGLFYLWYIPAILLLYILFPFFFKLFTSRKWTYILGLLPSSVITFCPPTLEWYHNCLLYRIGIFLWGIIFTLEFIYKEHRINKWLVYGVGIISFLFYLIRIEIALEPLCRLAEEIIFFITLPCILVCATWLFRYKMFSIMIGFVGKISLEFYLIHEFVMRFMETVSNFVLTMPPFVQKLVTLVVSLVLAYFVHMIIPVLMNKFSCKKKISA